MASPFMCMNVASGSVDAVSLFGICLSEELFLCRFQQVVNVCNVVIVLEEIGEFVQCLALLRSNILKFGVRNTLEASGNELVLLLLDEYFRVVVVIAEIKLELIHIDTFLVLDSEYALVAEHEAYATAGSERTSALCEIAADIGNCSGIVVCSSLYTLMALALRISSFPLYLFR